MSVLVCSVSHVRLCVTPWTIARQVPLSRGFSRQEHWSGLPFPPPGGGISNILENIGKWEDTRQI